MKNLLFSILCLWAGGSLAAQELNATVRINTPQLQRTERKVFDQLEVSLRDFMNNTKWGTDVFTQEERIKCTFIMTIETEGDNNNFNGNMP